MPADRWAADLVDALARRGPAFNSAPASKSSFATQLASALRRDSAAHSAFRGMTQPQSGHVGKPPWVVLAWVVVSLLAYALAVYAGATRSAPPPYPSGSLDQFTVDTVKTIGLLGIFLLMVTESAGVPIPSRITLLVAGSYVAHGNLSMASVIITGAIGSVVGALIAYKFGYYLRTGLLERHGARIGIKPLHMRSVDRVFARHGTAIILLGRMLPIIRPFMSLPAGVARMPFLKFTVLSTVGSIPWVAILALTGAAAGSDWARWSQALAYVDYAVFVLIFGTAWFGLRARHLRAAHLRAQPARLESEDWE